MRLLRALAPGLTRPLSVLVLAAWVVQMGVLVRRTAQSSSVALAADLSRYGSTAQWKGVYSRGQKIGFMVGQTLPTEDGYEIVEEGQLQMALLGAPTAARIRTSARVDRAFALKSFSFSLDPGTGAIEVQGQLQGRRLQLTVKTPTGTRSETRELAEDPALSLNLPRRLAAGGLKPGQRHEMMVFDPATLRNAPMVVEVEARELVRAAGRPVPAFRVKALFAGVTSTSWVTDLGEVVREESPLGFVVVKETPERATTLAVAPDVQSDLLQTAAVVPRPARRIDDPASVERLRVRLQQVDLSSPDVEGAGQTVTGDVVEVRSLQTPRPEAAGVDLEPYLRPELFIESDAPEIQEEARRAVAGVAGSRAQAERLVRHVNALLEKKPTVSLPSALEVLRTKVGDCNEHTALFVALARSLRIPSRIAVGIVHPQGAGAFYYHAWPEVYVEEPGVGRLWVPVDPTLNQYPADATHIRLARGGLDKQAQILPAMGRAQMRILDLELRPGSTPILVGQPAGAAQPLDFPLPRRDGTGATCWSRPS